MKLLGVEISEEEFEYLMSEQAKGKELKVVDNKVIAYEKVPTEKEIAQNELLTLKNWFDIEYMRLEQKFRRLHTLGKDYNGKNAYDELIQLYQIAEEKRQRIQELEALIDS